jgi:hypothetical protein
MAVQDAAMDHFLYRQRFGVELLVSYNMAMDDFVSVAGRLPLEVRDPPESLFVTNRSQLVPGLESFAVGIESR